MFLKPLISPVQFYLELVHKTSHLKVLYSVR